jgi:hypothetical protein
MEFQNFDAGLLLALDALLSEKSVTRAGERLHLSQPATSSILARLRRCFAGAYGAQDGADPPSGKPRAAGARLFAPDSARRGFQDGVQSRHSHPEVLPGGF